MGIFLTGFGASAMLNKFAQVLNDDDDRVYPRSANYPITVLNASSVATVVESEKQFPVNTFFFRRLNNLFFSSL